MNLPGFTMDRTHAGCVRRGGFVLVTVLLIIALVTILVVAGSMFAQVERRVTSTLSKSDLARQNALLALDIAVGQLQATAGLDQRITARADILSSNANNPYWTGVWVTGTNTLDVGANGTTSQRTLSLGAANATDAQKSANATWLVSGTNAPNPLTFSGGGNSVVLATGLGTNSTTANVTVPLVTMQSTATSGGAYAYWVSDEGVKARVNIYDPTIGAATPTGSSASTFARSQLHFSLPQATRVDGPVGNPGILGNGSLTEVRNQPILDRVASLQSMQFVGNITASQISGTNAAKYSPDATVWSQGVLADVRRGGLKKDLSAAFEDRTQFNSLLSSVGPLGGIPGDQRLFSRSVPTRLLATSSTSLQPLSSSNNTVNLAVGTRWQTLLNYYSLYKANVPFHGYSSPTSTACPLPGLGTSGTTTSPAMVARPYYYRSPNSSNSSVTVNGENLFPRFAAFAVELAMSSEAVTPTDAAGISAGLTYYRLRFHAKPMLVLYNPYNVNLTLPWKNSTTPAFLLNIQNDLVNRINWSVLVGNATVVTNKPLARRGTVNDGPYPLLTLGLSQDNSSGSTYSPTFRPGELKVFGINQYKELGAPGRTVPTNDTQFRERRNRVGGSAFYFLQEFAGYSEHADLYDRYGASQSAYLPADSFINNSSGNFTACGSPWQSGNGAGGETTNLPSTGSFTVVSGGDNVVLTLHTAPNSAIGESSGVFSFPDTTYNIPALNWPVTPDYSVVAETYKNLGTFTTGSGAVVLNPPNNTTVNLGPISGMLPNSSGNVVPKPFGVLIARLKGLNQSSTSQMPVFASADAMVNALSDTFDTSSVDVEFKFLQNPDSITNDLQVTASDPANSFWGDSNVGKTSSDPSAVILRDVPRQPLVSLGQFMHMVTFGYSYEGGPHGALTLQGAPLHSLGGSLASPLLALDKTAYDGPAVLNPPIDYNFLSNEALFDQYFFSTVPPASPDATYSALFPALVGPTGFNDAYVQAEGRLPNNRVKYYRRGGVAPSAADLQKWDTAAANLMLNGAFNINSTSIPAWRALLSSLSGNAMSYLSVPASGNGTATYLTKSAADLMNPILRFLTVASVDGTDPVNSKWGGVRSLTDAQVTELATQIVEQVKLRGPFLSMADFLNRRLDATTGLGYKGALQAAIDATTLNTSLGWGRATSGSPPLRQPAPIFNTTTMQQVAPNTAVGIPGWLMQQDIVQCFSPVMMARSDTFAIRVYGESRNPKTGAVEGKAWGEAVVQRTPDLVDGTQAANSAQSLIDSNPVNRQYGRRFKVVSFRWLNENDI